MDANPFTLIFGTEPQSFIPRNEEYYHIISDFESDRPTSSGNGDKSVFAIQGES